MKTRVLFTLTALLCVLSLLLCLSACNTNDPPPDDGGTTDQPSVEQPPEEPTFFKITPDTVIIRADNSYEHVAAAQLLRQKIKEVLGYDLKFRTDWDKPYSSEILVGPTNRDGAENFNSSFTAKDFGYAILSEGTMVISGGNGESSISGVEHFVETILKGNVTPESTVQLKIGDQEIVNYQYPVTTLTFAGKPLSDFTIQHSSSSAFKTAAEELAMFIEELTGVALPIVNSTGKPQTPETIYIQFDSGLGDFLTTYESQGNSFVIRASADRISMAVKSFTDIVFGEDPKGEIHVAATEGVVQNLLFADDECYNLQYTETTDIVKICPGVTRYTRHYVDRDGKPVKAYVIECAPGSVMPVLGTANGEYSLNTTQSILKQIEYEEAINGTDICAAVNGCFYTPDPLGLNVKNGQILCDNASSSYPSFGVLKDGSYYFGYPGHGNVDKEELEFAVGGFGLLLRDGALYDMGLSWPDAGIVKTRHPRTGIGATEDGTLYFVVVDGRQPSLSNGATLPDLALIFHELGCSDAINIDGGGSSISYTKDYETGEYTYWNSPSDGSPRSIKCATLIARNPDYKEEE